jgi:hypothetical protein
MNRNLSAPDVQVLHSWKEIASYLGRGVRTLQRYESNLGLPVHRPLGKARSSVLAFKDEIDRWLKETPLASLQPPNDATPERFEPSLRRAPRLENLYETVAKWRARTDSMQQGFASLQAAVTSMQVGLASTLERLEKTKTLVLKTKLHWEQTLTRRERRRMTEGAMNAQGELGEASASASSFVHSSST